MLVLFETGLRYAFRENLDDETDLRYDLPRSLETLVISNCGGWTLQTLMALAQHLPVAYPALTGIGVTPLRLDDIRPSRRALDCDHYTWAIKEFESAYEETASALRERGNECWCDDRKFL